MLDENEEVMNENVYIQPPKPNILTDEDTGGFRGGSRGGFRESTDP
jgi:hypothetical protein